MGVGVVAIDQPIAFGSCNLEMETLGTLHLTRTNEHIGIDEGNSWGFLGFVVSAGLGIGTAGLGFSVTGAW